MGVARSAKVAECGSEVGEWHIQGMKEEGAKKSLTTANCHVVVCVSQVGCGGYRLYVGTF